MQTFEQFKKEALKNKKVAQEYNRLGPRYQLASELIKARIKTGLTQKELARKVGTEQPAIARIESGDENLTIDSAQKITEALGATIRISIN